MAVNITLASAERQYELYKKRMQSGGVLVKFKEFKEALEVESKHGR